MTPPQRDVNDAALPESLLSLGDLRDKVPVTQKHGDHTAFHAASNEISLSSDLEV